MKVFHERPGALLFDETAYIAFLRNDWKVSDADIEQLEVRFVQSADFNGQFHRRSSQCAHDRILVSYGSDDPNRTLLHETRHFLRGGYEAGESKLRWLERPSEYDAVGFSVVMALTHTFVRLPTPASVSKVPSSVSVTPVSAVVCVVLGAAVVTVRMLLGGIRG